MSPLPSEPTKFILTKDQPVMTRRAQSIEPRLSEALLRACRASPEVSACYLLDVKKPNSDDQALHIALTVDDEARCMDQVAQRFWSEIRHFPERAGRIFVLSSKRIADDYAGSEFYLRGKPNHSAERTASQPTGQVGLFERLRRLVRGRSL
jgi:hypothetical protein